MGSAKSTNVKPINENMKEYSHTQSSATDTPQLQESSTSKAGSHPGEEPQDTSKPHRSGVPSHKESDKESSSAKSPHTTGTTLIPILKHEKKASDPSISKYKDNDVKDASKSEVKHKESKGKVATLEKQLAEAESERLDFLDRIADLEERLLIKEPCPISVSQTLALQHKITEKERWIAHLERELTNVKTTMTLQISKLSKKIKKLNARLSASQHEAALQHLELRDEILYLQEENNRLKLLLEMQPPLESTGESDDTSDDGKTKVILELSSQVLEQNERLTHLQTMLSERDQELTDLHKARSKYETASCCCQHASVGCGNSSPRCKPSNHPTEACSHRHSAASVGTRTKSNIGDKSSYANSASNFVLGFSDSDSDWESNHHVNKIRSAPPGFRSKSEHSPRPKLSFVTAKEKCVYSCKHDDLGLREHNYTQQSQITKESSLVPLGPALATGTQRTLCKTNTSEISSELCEYDIRHCKKPLAPISTR